MQVEIKHTCKSSLEAAWNDLKGSYGGPAKMGPDKSHQALLQLGAILREAGGRGHQLRTSAEVGVVHVSTELTLPVDSIHCVVFLIASFIVAIRKNKALSRWVESIRGR